MPNHPLAEVFGFPINNLTAEADRHRQNRLCPFGNAVPNCTKASIENPLGVCSVFGASGEVVITCPVRFQQGWRIASDAATFFFSPGAAWTSLTEVRLKDSASKSAGNIDVVLLSYDSVGRIVDYGSLEVQAVYISGNVSTPFKHYMEAPHARANMDWRGQRNYPRPDYLSSSRKRLAPQLIFKGGILNGWGRKMAVALNTGFYNTLPALDEVDPADANLAFFVYDLVMDPMQNRYVLTLIKTVYTNFEPALLKITRSEAGEEALFLGQLQKELDRRLSNATAPDAITPNAEF
jgi:hypothetical protein